jgi:hypothetical protein
MAKKIEIKKVVVEDASKSVNLMPPEVQAFIKSSNNEIRKAVRAMFGKIEEARMGIQDALICLSVSYAMILNQAKTPEDKAQVRQAFKEILAYTDLDLIGSKHFLSQDWSSHWMIVPVSKRKEFEDWVEAEDDAIKPPEGAEMIGGNPNTIEFYK